MHPRLGRLEVLLGPAPGWVTVLVPGQPLPRFLRLRDGARAQLDAACLPATITCAAHDAVSGSGSLFLGTSDGRLLRLLPPRARSVEDMLQQEHEQGHAGAYCAPAPCRFCCSSVPFASSGHCACREEHAYSVPAMVLYPGCPADMARQAERAAFADTWPRARRTGAITAIACLPGGEQSGPRHRGSRRQRAASEGEGEGAAWAMYEQVALHSPPPMAKQLLVDTSLRGAAVWEVPLPDVPGEVQRRQHVARALAAVQAGTQEGVAQPGEAHADPWLLEEGAGLCSSLGLLLAHAGRLVSPALCVPVVALDDGGGGGGSGARCVKVMSHGTSLPQLLVYAEGCAPLEEARARSRAATGAWLQEYDARPGELTGAQKAAYGWGRAAAPPDSLPHPAAYVVPPAAWSTPGSSSTRRRIMIQQLQVLRKHECVAQAPVLLHDAAAPLDTDMHHRALWLFSRLYLQPREAAGGKEAEAQVETAARRKQGPGWRACGESSNAAALSAAGGLARLRPIMHAGRNPLSCGVLAAAAGLPEDMPEDAAVAEAAVSSAPLRMQAGPGPGPGPGSATGMDCGWGNCGWGAAARLSPGSLPQVTLRHTALPLGSALEAPSSLTGTADRYGGITMQRRLRVLAAAALEGGLYVCLDSSLRLTVAAVPRTTSTTRALSHSLIHVFRAIMRRSTSGLARDVVDALLADRADMWAAPCFDGLLAERGTPRILRLPWLGVLEGEGEGEGAAAAGTGGFAQFIAVQLWRCLLVLRIQLPGGRPAAPALAAAASHDAAPRLSLAAAYLTEPHRRIAALRLLPAAAGMPHARWADVPRAQLQFELQHAYLGALAWCEVPLAPQHGGAADAPIMLTWSMWQPLGMPWEQRVPTHLEFRLHRSPHGMSSAHIPQCRACPLPVDAAAGDAVLAAVPLLVACDPVPRAKSPWFRAGARMRGMSATSCTSGASSRESDTEDDSTSDDGEDADDSSSCSSSSAATVLLPPAATGTGRMTPGPDVGTGAATGTSTASGGARAGAGVRTSACARALGQDAWGVEQGREGAGASSCTSPAPPSPCRPHLLVLYASGRVTSLAPGAPAFHALWPSVLAVTSRMTQRAVTIVRNAPPQADSGGRKSPTRDGGGDAVSSGAASGAGPGPGPGPGASAKRQRIAP